jgi:predicted nucleic acid-binding Zn ribbon protein
METGKACKTCGMILEDSGKDFCSKVCRNVYERLRRIN